MIDTLPFEDTQEWIVSAEPDAEAPGARTAKMHAATVAIPAARRTRCINGVASAAKIWPALTPRRKRV
jgi:hypothetical protein